MSTMDERWTPDAPPTSTDRHSWMLSDVLHSLTTVLEVLEADVRDRQLHRLDRYHVAQLVIQGVEAYGRLIRIHELEVKLDRTRSQLSELQARWDEATRERGWD